MPGVADKKPGEDLQSATHQDWVWFSGAAKWLQGTGWGSGEQWLSSPADTVKETATIEGW